MCAIKRRRSANIRATASPPVCHTNGRRWQSAWPRLKARAAWRWWHTRCAMVYRPPPSATCLPNSKPWVATASRYTAAMATKTTASTTRCWPSASAFWPAQAAISTAAATTAAAPWALARICRRNVSRYGRISAKPVYRRNIVY